MLWSASTITSVSSDTEPTIVVQFESGKYVFNAGENTGRAWLQSRSRWAKTKAIFLTQNGTQRGSGLPGLMMFLADAGTKELEVVGPRGLTHFLASMRSYLWRDGMSVKVTEAEDAFTVIDQPTPVYKDSNVDIYSIPVFDPSLDASVLMTVDKKRKRSSSPAPKASSKKPHIGDNNVHNKSPEVVAGVLPTTFTPDFSPSLLRGPHAEEWRELTIRNMFPVVRSSPPPPEQKKSGKKGREQKTQSEAGDLQPATRPHGSGGYQHVLAHRDRLLPKFQSKKSQICTSYVIVGPAVRGKFDAKKADVLGVPRGRIRGKLTQGESVTFEVDDGQGGKTTKTVHSAELMGPSDPPHAIIILDVPTVNHIPSLESAFNESPFFSRLRSQNEAHKKECVVHAIFHLCGKDVLETNAYKAFLDGFPSTTHHIIASRQHAPDAVTFTSAAANQLALSQLDSTMFPEHKYRISSPTELSLIPSLSSNIHYLRSGLNIEVRPARGPVVDQAFLDYDRFHPIVTGAKPLAIPDKTLKAFDDAQTIARNLPQRVSKPSDNVAIVPLGTSSAMPSKYRNVSSTLIQIPDHGNILLDCGEGTWGQLARSFGSDDTSGVWRILRDIKCIYLSHIHGDHHIGLSKVLAMRKQLDPPPKEPLYVVAVRSVHLYLREQADIEDLGIDDPSGNGVISILSDSLNFRGPNTARYGKWQLKDGDEWMSNERSVALSKDLCTSLGLRGFTTVDVDHRTRCYGLVLDHEDDWRIVFSGDTKPTPNLVTAGKNATVLIHEATMGDDQEELAAQKAHSTIGQAIRIGTDMNASNIMLTHFSARYPKMPPAIGSSDTKANVVLAFDHARVRIGDMLKLHAYMPALEQFYSDVSADDEDPEDITPLIEADVPDA